MIVTKRNFANVLKEIGAKSFLSIDTETTGLRPYQGHVLFSIIVAHEDSAWYFNFNQYEDVDEDSELLLGPCELKRFAEMTAAVEPTWFLHNAKFDLHMLAKEGIYLHGIIHCTKAVERIKHNDLMPRDYSLAMCAERMGEAKDTTVEDYVERHKLFDTTVVDGKKKKVKDAKYHLVPFDIIVPYGEKDAVITYKLGMHQLAALAAEDSRRLSNWPKIAAVLDNERRLTPTLFRMEKAGVKVDLEFCEKAIAYEKKRIDEAKAKFKELTGKDFKKSGKLFQEIFASEKEKWGKTNPKKTKSGKAGISFDKKTVLPRFENPAAGEVISLAEAKANIDYYLGFKLHADKDGVIHANLNQDGTDTGRLSSSQPNLQNMKRVEEGESLGEFTVRRAIVPRDGNCFMFFDYDQLQYRLMLDYAGAKGLIAKVLSGLDVHQATADVAGIDRYKAKTTNFSILFGAGIQLLATNLKVSVNEAKVIKESIFRAAPEIETFIKTATAKAEKRGYVFSWLGRRYDLPNARLSYTAPNKIIQGGEAELIKIGMNRMDDLLSSTATRLVLSVHDEIITEGPAAEARVLGPKIKEILEGIYPYRHLPLTVGASYSFKSMADKEKGFVP